MDLWNLWLSCLNFKIRWVVNYFEEMMSSKSAASSPSVPSIAPSISWVPPPYGKIKSNVDGEFNHPFSKSGVGVIFRNHLGQPLAALSSPLSTSSSPLHAELAAIFEGISMALAMGFSEIILESDSLLAVNAINLDSPLLNERVKT